MKDYRVTVAPNERADFTPPDRRSRWTLTTIISAKSKNDARKSGLRRIRTYLADRAIRIVRVEEAA